MSPKEFHPEAFCGTSGPLPLRGYEREPNPLEQAVIRNRADQLRAAIEPKNGMGKNLKFSFRILKNFGILKRRD